MTGDFLIVKKYLSNPLVTGTIFLTLAGTTSRFMGFFFRIFLNNVMGSTGLGLYLAKLILDKLEFQIAISSEIGEGTCVMIKKE